MAKIKITITMDEELYDDLTEVVEDSYNYGFQTRGHLITVAVVELLTERGYYDDDDDDDDDDQ